MEIYWLRSPLYLSCISRLAEKGSHNPNLEGWIVRSPFGFPTGTTNSLALVYPLGMRGKKVQMDKDNFIYCTLQGGISAPVSNPPLCTSTRNEETDNYIVQSAELSLSCLCVYTPFKNTMLGNNRSLEL